MVFQFKGKCGPVSITAIGGVERAGAANCYLLESKNESIMLDCGLGLDALSEDLSSKESVRIFYPNFSFLEGYSVDTILLSHLHLDHIGGLSELAKYKKDIKTKLISRDLTLRAVKKMLIERSGEQDWTRGCEYPFTYLGVKAEERTRIQNGFVVPVSVPHSTPQSTGFFLNFSGKNIIYLGDFKTKGLTSQQSHDFSWALHRLRKQKVDVLLLDSTNASEDGFTQSDIVVWQELERIFQNVGNRRIIFSTFSSHLDRVAEVIRLAAKQKRPVYATGRSLINSLTMAKIHGWSVLARNSNVCPRNAIILTTGCQAESCSGLVNALYGCAPFRLSREDAVVIAADPIPVPIIETRFKKMVEGLRDIVGTVYVSNDAPDISGVSRADIHVSGHGKSGDLVAVVEKLSPGLVVPIHGDTKRRVKLAELVRQRTGVATEVIEESSPLQL